LLATTGLIAAMSLEGDAFLRCIRGWKRIPLGSFNGVTFELSGQNYLLVVSGMGFRRAREAASRLVAMNATSALISFGIAGAVDTDLRVGDVVMAEAVCQLEQGVPGSLKRLTSWSQPAQEAAALVLSKRGARLFTGIAVTTGGTQITKAQLGTMPHAILEMETAGIAQAAEENGIPLFSLRAISDGPRAPIPFDLGAMLDKDANLKINRILRVVCRSPRILFQFRKLMRNSKIAAGNAAAALMAALSQTTF
jgi:adenosylhomocysteine nucleosidase